MDTNTNTLPQTVAFEVENFKSITDQAPAMLEQNETSKAKAAEFYSGLAGSIVAHGMSDPMDEQLKMFINKAKITINTMNERRKPFTQLVDAVKKRFTSQESELKQTIEEAQKHRDAYATKKMQERLEEERRAQLKLAKEKELILLRQQAETQLAAHVAKVISENRQSALNRFNSFTLQTIEHADEELDGIELFPTERQLQPEVKLSYSLATADEANAIIESGRAGFEYSFMERHGTEMSLFIRELKDKIHSKRRELEELAKAGEAEKVRIEEERRKREEAEKARIAAEEEAARKKAEEEAAVRASAQTANAMVDNVAQLFDEKPDVKTGYRITVSSTAAYLVMAQYWYEKEGKNLTVEKLEKVTFDRMRRFVEDFALKNDEFIDNKTIRYEPVYKAK